MKSLCAEMVEEISRLTEEELRERLISAEHLIYVLEARLKDARGIDSRGPLHGNDMYNLIGDEKTARAAYTAAREKATFFCCPPAITCKCNTHKMVELFGLHGDSAVTDFTASIQALGIQVVAKACPPSTAEWVELPFLREKSGSSYYGPEAINGFITRIMQEPRICEHKWDGDEVITGGRGYGSSVTCSKCGMSAMSHDVRCC